ncbi:MAG: NAD-dependent epimerase/dehydratase family protein, partial [Candidatus Moraniibacteriota bacterium]
ASGEQVTVFDNLSAGSANNLLNGETLIVGDIRDKDALNKAFKSQKFEVVIHLAALVNAAESVTQADLYTDVNDHGSRNVWEAARENNVPYALYASSAAVYGTPESAAPIKETHPLRPTSPYGATKLAGEVSLRETYDNYLAFRFFNVGGAESEGRLLQSKESRAIMPRLYEAAYNQKGIVISGNDYDTPDGTVIRDFVHVEDIALAFVLGISYLRSGKESVILNLGGGVTTSIKQVHEMVEKAASITIPITYAPRNVGDISYSLADIKLAKNTIGWTPKYDLFSIISSGYHAYVKKSN